MKIDRVLLCWDGHASYAGMWQLHQLVWPRLGVKPTLLFVGSPRGLNLTGDVVALRPPFERADMDKLSWQTPMALVCGARMFPGETCMTSGIDQVPLSRRFIDAVAEVPDDRFVVGFGGAADYEASKDAYGYPYYPSSHMVATSRMWLDVLDGTPDNFTDFVRWAWETRPPIMWQSDTEAWGLDEAIISKLLANDNIKMEVFSRQFFTDWDRSRLGRCTVNKRCDMNRLLSGGYSEIHFHRPLQQDEIEIVRRLAESLT